MCSIIIITALLFSYLALSDAVLCYNCSNVGDRRNYCINAEIHNMKQVKCPGKKCLYFDLNKGLLLFFNSSPLDDYFHFILVFIDRRIVRRSCLEVDDQCVSIRDTPGNDLNQCVICSWDLCNNSWKPSVFYCVFYVVLIFILRAL